MQHFELFLAVDEEGNAAVSMDGPAEAREALLEDFESAVIRGVKVTVAMELPEVREVDVEVPKHEEEVEAEVEETETEEEEELERAAA